MMRTASRCRRYAWVFAFFAIRAEATDLRWTATVAPPRPSLPAVTVTMGEPGYVSKANTAIELNAVASNAAFDGYIGYHLEVAGNQTIDVPVVARAVLAPHQLWTFNTWLQVTDPQWQHSKRPQRELVVEWRDRSMRLTAKKVAGKPSWSESSPLQVVRDGETATTPCCFGSAAQVRRPADLSIIAQWYSSFSRLVIRTDLWLDLPQQVREAAVSSGLRRVFIGAPRPDQQLSELDRAVIPVEFLRVTAETNLPSPHSQKSGITPSATSWRAKQGAVIAGSESSPYLVDDGWNVFLADTSTLGDPLPTTRRLSQLPSGLERPHRDRDVADIVRFDLVMIVAIAILLLTLVLPVMLVRSLRVVAMVITVATAVALLACRDQLRVRALTHRRDEWKPEGLGAMRHWTEVNQYGPSPLAENPIRPEERRLLVTGIGDVRQEAELRGSGTAPGHGAVFMSAFDREWDSTSRWARRTEFGQPVKITIRDRKHDTMTFDYEAPFPVDFARARWIWNGAVHFGDGRLNGTKRGTATVHNMAFLRALEGDFRDFRRFGDSEVMLVAVRETGTAAITWKDPDKSQVGSQWQMTAELHADANGIGRCSFVVPRFAPGATVWVGNEDVIRLKSFTATFEGVDVPLLQDPTLPGNRRLLDPASVQRMATEGGVLSVAMEQTEGSQMSTAPWVTLHVKEKSHD